MGKTTYTLHPVLHEVHGPELLQHKNILVPVAHPGHWASIWIDTTKRTINYLDSYFQGGAEYLQAMRVYLIDFETKLGITPQLPWTCTETTHRRSHEYVTHIYLPRQ